MISACIIAKNEEKHIANCLNSIMNYVDEIILVDTGSSDNTLAIVRQYPCKIYFYNWADDFSAARNYSIAKAKSDFIIYIDADEILRNGHELLSITQNSDANIGGFFANIISYNQKNQSVLSKQVRIFRNNPQFKFTGRIHEQISDSISQANYQIQESNININHLGYKIDNESLKQKYIRNLNLIELERKAADSNYYKIHHSRTLAAINRYDEAINLLKNMLNSFLNQNENCEVLNLLAEIYLSKKEYRLSINFYEQSFKTNNSQIYVINQLSNLYFYLNQYDKALYYIGLLEEINKYSNGNVAINLQELIFKKSKLLLLLKEYANALNYLYYNYNNFKDDIDILYLYSNALFKCEKYEQALDVLHKISSLDVKYRDVNDLILKIKKFINSENNNKPLLSLCMIVKNEEKFLEGCLESVQNIVDEIIIVDTGSADKTIEIAKKYTDNIYHFQWLNDFSIARNESLKYAKGKWILYLDADERLILHNKNTFKELLNNADENIGGINCIIESKSAGGLGNSSLERGFYPRIFRNYGYPNIRFEGKVHEQIVNSIEELGKSIINSDIIINHLGYDASENIINEKVHRNLALLHSSLNDNPNDGYTLFQLAQSYLMIDNYSSAIDYFNKALKVPNLSLEFKANIYNTLAQIAGIKGNFFSAIELAKQSLEITQNQELAWAILADGLQKIGRMQDAIQAYKSLLNYKRNGTPFLEIGFDQNIDEDKIETVIRNLESKVGN